jgi:hypothetical protein
MITEVKTLVSFEVLPFFLPAPPKKGVKRQRILPKDVANKLYAKITVKFFISSIVNKYSIPLSMFSTCLTFEYFSCCRNIASKII